MLRQRSSLCVFVPNTEDFDGKGLCKFVRTEEMLPLSILKVIYCFNVSFLKFALLKVFEDFKHKITVWIPYKRVICIKKGCLWKYAAPIDESRGLALIKVHCGFSLPIIEKGFLPLNAKFRECGRYFDIRNALFTHNSVYQELYFTLCFEKKKVLLD